VLSEKKGKDLKKLKYPADWLFRS